MMQLIQIFYEPGKVFDFVREHRAWIVALIANCLLLSASSYYMTNAIGGGNITRHMLDNSKFAANMPADAKEKQIAEADVPATKIRNTVIAFFVIAIIFAFSALLFMAIAAISGGPIKFTQAMGTVCYSTWPVNLIRTILGIIVVAIAVDKSDLDPQHLLAFNAGALLDKATAAKPLYALATSFDLITFAGIALSAYG